MNLIFLEKKVIIKEARVRKGGNNMTKERLEELTHEYLQGMKARVMTNGVETMSLELKKEQDKVKDDFIKIDDRLLEKYREEFEFDPMTGEFNVSLENIVNRVYDKIVTIHRQLEQDKKIEEVETQVTQEDRKKEVSYRRTSAIDEHLRRAIERIKQKMKIRDVYGFINWETFEVAYNRVINNHIESIEQNVFEKQEDNMVIEEVERYLDEVKFEMKKQRPNDMELEFKVGSVCPIVTDINRFAQINKQIALEVEKEEREEKLSREDSFLDLPGDVIE